MIKGLKTGALRTGSAPRAPVLASKRLLNKTRDLAKEEVVKVLKGTVLFIVLLAAVLPAAAQRNRAVRPGPCAATLTFTRPATAITATTFVLNGDATVYGMNATWHFEYGKDADHLVATPEQGMAPFGSLHIPYGVSNADPDTTYYFRFVVTDSCGVHRGDLLSLTTASQPPPAPETALRVSLAPTSPAAGQVPMGTLGKTVLVLRLEAVGPEDIRLAEISLTDLVSKGAPPVFENMVFMNPLVMGVRYAGPTAATEGYAYRFGFGGPLILPKNSSLDLPLLVDVPPYGPESAAADNSTHQFRVNAGGILAFGVSSAMKVPVVGSATGSLLTVLRSRLTANMNALGPQTARVRQSADDILALAWTADQNGNAAVEAVSLRFSGPALATGIPFTVRLLDPATGTDWAGLGPATCIPQAVGVCDVSFALNSPWLIPAGSTKTVRVRINSANFADSPAAPDALTVAIPLPQSVIWGDGSVSGLPLDTAPAGLTVLYQ